MSEILSDERVKSVLEKMRSRCSVREYCSSDVSERVFSLLRGEDLPWSREEVAEAIIANLKFDGFLSDERYAAAFARDKAYLVGWGAAKIRMSLYAKHLDEATVNAALAKVDATAVQNQLERLLFKKLNSLLGSRSGRAAQAAQAVRSACSACSDETSDSTADELDLRNKLIRFGLGRGYPYDSVLSAADTVLQHYSLHGSK